MDISRQDTANPLRSVPVFIGMAIAIGIMTGSVPAMFSFPFVIAGFGLLLGVIIASRLGQSENFTLINLFILAFLARMAILVFLYNFVYVRTGFGEFGDALSYSINGGCILDLWLNGERNLEALTREAFRISASGTLTSYDFWNAIVFFFTGKNPVSPILINCLAGSLTPVFIYDITNRLYNKKAALTAAVLTAFWPSLLLWSIQNLKEPLSFFLGTVIIWVLLTLRAKFRFYLLFLVAFFAIFLKEFRFFLLAALFLAFLVSFLVPFLKFRRNISLWFIAAIFILFAILCLNSMSINYDNIFDTIKGSPLSEKLSALTFLYHLRSEKVLGAGSSFLANWQFKNSLGYFFLFMPVALLASLFAPFPWMLGSAMQIMAIPEMLVFYTLVPAIFAGSKFIIKYKIKEGAVLMTYVIIMYIVLAITEGNIGTLFRHRSMVLPLVFVLAGIGLFQKHDRIKN